MGRSGRAMAIALVLVTAWQPWTGPPAAAAPVTLGNLTGISQTGSSFLLSAGNDRVRVTFHQPDVFRIWLGPGGSFTDPVGTDILTRTDFGAVTTSLTDAGSYHRIESDAVVLRVYKTPLRFALYKKDNATLVWQESTGLTWDTALTRQRLTRAPDEQFYGGGLRLGAWALRDQTVPIRIDNRWNEGNNASRLGGAASSLPGGRGSGRVLSRFYSS